MFDAELKNVGHVFGSKMVTFIMDQGSNMDATLKAMKALIASCTELFLATVESSEEEETSSRYSDLTPHDIVEIQGVTLGGGNQHEEEVKQVEDITAITAPPVAVTEEVVLIVDGCPGSAAACNTCSGISAGEPTVRTIGAGCCGESGPRGSDPRTQWTRGVSATSTCSKFSNGQSGPRRVAEVE
jgi:hypothetical protein